MVQKKTQMKLRNVAGLSPFLCLLEQGFLIPETQERRKQRGRDEPGSLRLLKGSGRNRFLKSLKCAARLEVGRVKKPQGFC